MKFLKTIFKRPITTCLTVLVLILVGLYSTSIMPVKLLPNIDIPVMGVTAVYPGASPDVVEEQVTKPLEKAIKTVEKVTDVTTLSSNNFCVITINFEFGIDANQKEAQLKEVVSSVALPEGAQAPSVISVDLNTTSLASISVTGDDFKDVKEATNELSDLIKRVGDVARVSVLGVPQNKLILTPIRGLELSSLLIVEALNKSSYTLPLGVIETDEGSVLVKTDMTKETTESLLNTKINVTFPRSLLETLENASLSINDEMMKNSDFLISFFNNHEFSSENLAKIKEAKVKMDLAYTVYKDKEKIAQMINEENLVSVHVTKEMVDFFLNISITEIDELYTFSSNFKEKGIPLSFELLNLVKTIDYSKIKYEGDMGSFLIPIKDIVRVDEKTENESIFYYNSKLSTSIDIYGKTGSNASEIVKNIKEVLKNYKNENVEVVLLNEQTKFIDDSISGVLTSIIIGGFFAILVIYLFLRKIKLSLVISITMPLSVILTLLLLNLIGVTLNMVSLGGLAVGIGMLVDGSIVVIEAITKRLENENLTVEKAALKGVKDVASSLIASTITTICVFIPILFTEGLTKEIFTDLSFAVIFSLSVSLIVALTIIPSFYVLFCKNDNAQKQKIKEAKWMAKIEEKYQVILEWLLRKKVLFIGIVLTVFMLSIGLVFTRGMEFLPPSDQGLIEVTLTHDSSSTILEAEALTKKIEQIIINEEENIESIATSIGNVSLVNNTMATIIKIKLNKNAPKTIDVVEKIRKAIKKEVNASLVVKEVDGIVASLTSGFNDLTISITGEKQEVLEQIANDVKAKLLQNKNITDVTDNLAGKQKTYKIYLDDEKCQEYGIDQQLLAMTLRVGLSGIDILTMEDSQETLEIALKFDENAIKSKTDLENFTVSFSDANQIKLADVAQILEEDEFIEIIKENGHLQLKLKFSCINLDTGSASQLLKKEVSEVLKNYPGYEMKSTGVQAYLDDAFSGLVVSLIISFFLLYIVMACQFESFIKPIIIMTSIPLTFTGSFLALTITNISLNVVSFIGIIMLMGVIVNNAIIMLDEIKRLKDEGLSDYDALINGCKNRIRPIFMTTLTTILALIPLSLAIGSGAELMQPIGVVVIGGLLLGTVVTLGLIPTIYATFKKIKK